MNNKKILIPVFILVALAQLFVPAKMILDREDILDTGKEYKFKTSPIDPYDPFRGKYITLRFDDNTFEIQNDEEWNSGETVYVLLTSDSDGFAKIESVSKEKIANSPDFVKAKVDWVNGLELNIDYPFDRYYMEESKALEAEQEYRASQIDTNQVTYALVSIKDGDAVLKDVLLDGVPIREVVLRERETKPSEDNQ